MTQKFDLFLLRLGVGESDDRRVEIKNGDFAH